MPNLQEYMVKLGIQLDTTNMAKLERFLTSGKFKASMMGASLVALTKIIYNFVKQQTTLYQSYETLARHEEKSIQLIMQREMALKAMGKTQKEVADDPSLKKMYDGLRNLGKDLSLPDMKNALSGVRSLQEAFYRLKMTIQYALQWTNYHLLLELAGPMKTVKGWMDSIQNWVQTNLRTVSRGIAIFLGDFMRGILGIFEVGKAIGDFFNGLPAAVRGVGAAIISLVAMLQAGPIGWLIGAVTMIGDLMKDYSNWKLVNSDPNYAQYKDQIALPGLWEILDGEGTFGDKLNQLMVKAMEGFNIKLPFDFSGLKGDIEDQFDENGVKIPVNLGAAISDWVTNHKTEIRNAGTVAGILISNGISAAGEIANGLLNAISLGLTGEEFTIQNEEAMAGVAAAIAATLFGAGPIGIALAGALGTLAADEDFRDAAFELGQSVSRAFIAGLMSLMGGVGGLLVSVIYGKDSDEYKAWQSAQKALINDALGVEDPELVGFADNGAPVSQAEMAIYDAIYPETAKRYRENADSEMRNVYDYIVGQSGIKLWNQMHGEELTPELAVMSPAKPASLGVFQYGLSNPAAVNAWDQLVSRYKNALNNEDASGSKYFADAIAAFQSGADSAASEVVLFGMPDFSAVADAANAAIQNWDGKPKIETEVVVDNQQAHDAVQKAVEGPYVIEVVPGSSGSSSGGFDALNASREAMGGRLTNPSHILAGEDGTEYVVPVTKPGRAIPLVVGALREMGSNAARRVMNMMGFDGDTSTIGGAARDAGISMPSGTIINNNISVNAPVSIVVNGGGADAAVIGSTVYDAAERSLIRTVEGVFA